MLEKIGQNIKCQKKIGKNSECQEKMGKIEMLDKWEKQVMLEVEKQGMLEKKWKKWEVIEKLIIRKC